MRMKIPYKLIENLKDKAQEIEAEFIVFIQKVPLSYHPSRSGSVISIGFPEYSWKIISSDLSKMQTKLVGKYRSWYNQSAEIIKNYLPDDLNEFKKKLTHALMPAKNPAFREDDLPQLRVARAEGGGTR